SAGGRLEARIAGDGVVGQDSAVAPAADAQAGGIGIALLHRFVHTGQQVFDFVMTPVGEDRLLICFAASGAAPVVHVQHCVSARCEELALDDKAVSVLAVGAAMDS